jgi:hypothetical protein
MTVRKAMLGLCVICALLVSAVAASGAGATVQSFTCSQNAPVKAFSTATCDSPLKGTTWGHESFGTTETKVTTLNTGNSVLKATVAGASVVLTSTSLTSEEGKMHNVGPGTEVTGTGKIKYEHVTANHGCKVTGTASEVVTTKLLHAHTTSASTLTFEPNSGTEFAEFTLSGCEAGFAFLNHAWHVTGKVVGEVKGATTVFKHTTVTTAGTLFVEGNVAAGLEGVLDLLGENGKRLALT